jgi:hypothetical protein
VPFGMVKERNPVAEAGAVWPLRVSAGSASALYVAFCNDYRQVAANRVSLAHVSVQKELFWSPSEIVIAIS